LPGRRCRRCPEPPAFIDDLFGMGTAKSRLHRLARGEPCSQEYQHL
jgi:hypothetical protein